MNEYRSIFKFKYKTVKAVKFNGRNVRNNPYLAEFHGIQ